MLISLFKLQLNKHMNGRADDLICKSVKGKYIQ